MVQNYCEFSLLLMVVLLSVLKLMLGVGEGGRGQGEGGRVKGDRVKGDRVKGDRVKGVG